MTDYDRLLKDCLVDRNLNWKIEQIYGKTRTVLLAKECLGLTVE